MAELVLHVQDLDESGKDYTFTLTPAWIDACVHDAGLRADPVQGAGSLQVHAQQNGSEYLVEGTLKAQLVAECGRCLGPAHVPVQVEFATLFSRDAAQALPELYELGEQDFQRESFSGHEIVLDALVREHLVLEVPMQPLCSPDCRGIPIPQHVRPPADLVVNDADVDPRLAPLTRLRDKVPPKKE